MTPNGLAQILLKKNAVKAHKSSETAKRYERAGFAKFPASRGPGSPFAPAEASGYNRSPGWIDRMSPAEAKECLDSSVRTT
jgi:hypothetical protein